MLFYKIKQTILTSTYIKVFQTDENVNKTNEKISPDIKTVNQDETWNLTNKNVYRTGKTVYDSDKTVQRTY